MLGQSFCLIIYMLKNRDVLGLSAYLPSVYEGRCRHYRMVSKLCGMLVAEERVNYQHNGNHVSNKTSWYCCCPVTQSFPTLSDPWHAARQAFLSFTTSRRLFRLRSIESVMPSNHVILCNPLLLLPSILPSIRIFSNEHALHIRWPKHWSFSISKWTFMFDFL